jgi:hypothetical protein
VNTTGPARDSRPNDPPAPIEQAEVRRHGASKQ